nr:MAG TPA_asm: hypothetical protein [Caudoviricetes sp.]
MKCTYSPLFQQRRFFGAVLFFRNPLTYVYTYVIL